VNLLLLVLACKPDPHSALPPADASWAYAPKPGDAIDGLDADTLAAFTRGQELMKRKFRTDQGLGPDFNTSSCAHCHQAPKAGGSSPRYRDFWLVRRVRADGAAEDLGTNGTSPVRDLYVVPPTFHIPTAADCSIFARRNAPPAFGVGLFSFVSDETILKRADPDDADGDGISGRPNYEQGLVGRFGYKSQASRIESFNRGAMLNQMGLTSDPLLYAIPGEPQAGSGSLGALWLPGMLLPGSLLTGTAHAQVSAPGEPTTDDDGVPDPELSDDDQLDLLIFSIYVGAIAPGPETADSRAGAALFEQVGCADCHVPTLDSTRGPVPAYSDLLLHDMGPDLADGIGAGLATGSEFRTQPLWGLTWSAPYLHDGRADTLQVAIEDHAGESQDSRDRYLELSQAEQAQVIAFLGYLGGTDPQGQILAMDPVPAVGEPGGPDQMLSEADLATWMQGRALFDKTRTIDEGLGTWFNADSCRACHQDPVLGGAGGLDTNVLRMGSRDLETAAYSPLERAALPRSVVFGPDPYRLPDAANVIEGRNPPTTLGVGLLERISEAAILANADPDDADGDGVTGVARILPDGRLGRFGWKAQIPTVYDFAADALLNENGITIDTAKTDFSSADDGDDMADPEEATSEHQAVSFYLEHLSPPQGTTPQDPTQAARGQELFGQVGCDECHLPELDGVAAFTDLLIHDVAPDPMVLVDQEDGLLPSEYRTAPLWGVVDTAPYLHDGSAPTLETAVTEGHMGEANTSREAYIALSAADQAALIVYLQSL